MGAQEDGRETGKSICGYAEMDNGHAALRIVINENVRGARVELLQR